MKKRRHMLRRIFASTLSLAMIGTMMPAVVLDAKEGISAALLADFTFDDEASVTGGGNAKAVVNGMYELRSSKDAESGQALYLNGDAGNYLAVTNSSGGSLLAGKEEITISYDAKPDRTETNWAFYAAPNADTQVYAKEHYIGGLHGSGNLTVERYHNVDGRPSSAKAEVGNGWAHVDVVFRENTTSIYVNRIKRAEVGSDYKLTDILGNSGVFYIGRANWVNGEGYKGWIDNFKVYGEALTDDQLVDAQAAVEEDKNGLTLPEETIGDFVLASEGASGSKITWTVSDNENAVIGEDGYHVRITRPTEKDVTVTFTATIKLQDVTGTKEIRVKIPKEKTDEEVLEEVYDKLDIATKEDVRGNISLPEEMGAEGTLKKAQITWMSSDETIVTDTEVDEKAPGVVTRPKKDTDVTMTAVIRCGKEELEKEFTLHVAAAPRYLAKTTDYLFAYFTGTEYNPQCEQIYFSTSENGSQWKDMTAEGNPVLSSEIGDKGVRDPYLIRSPEGDKFYMIATDLSIFYRGGWGNANATVTGSTSLIIWESLDLVNWSSPRLVDVAGPIPGAGCAWAPEAMYDADTGNYVVYWATASGESNANGDPMNMYYATTRDFYTFSEPVLWIDRQSSIIDTTMIQVGDKYYRASGDGQITIEESDSIYEGWKIIGTLKDIFGNNNYSGAKLEGPEFFKYNEDDWLKDAEGNAVETWGLMCDQYAEGRGYLPFRTTNIADQTTASWSPANDVNFGNLKKRHGTILPITREEYRRVMQEIGGISIPAPDTDKEALQAEIKRSETISYEKYTEASAAVYKETLETAKAVMADENATQEEINETEKKLKDAYAALKKVLPFEDVKEGDWFYDGIYYNWENGYMRGKDDTQFAPLETLVRAQFAVILHRIEGEPSVEYAKTFPDVADQEWYTDAILWAAGKKIVTGYTDTGLFGTADNINREQMAVMMYRYAQFKNYNVEKKADFDQFDDAEKVSGFAREAMQWAVGNGIITGKYEGTQIDPQGNALRGECAIIIQRFMELYK